MWWSLSRPRRCWLNAAAAAASGIQSGRTSDGVDWLAFSELQWAKKDESQRWRRFVSVSAREKANLYLSAQEHCSPNETWQVRLQVSCKEVEKTSVCLLLFFPLWLPLTDWQLCKVRRCTKRLHTLFQRNRYTIYWQEPTTDFSLYSKRGKV